MYIHNIKPLVYAADFFMKRAQPHTTFPGHWSSQQKRCRDLYTVKPRFIVPLLAGSLDLPALIPLPRGASNLGLASFGISINAAMHFGYRACFTARLVSIDDTLNRQ